MDISALSNLMGGHIEAAKLRASAPVDAEMTDPRLLDAARDFEAMLLESWWRSMKATFGEDESEVGGAAMDDLGIEAMSTAVAGGGGLGLADALLEQLTQVSRALVSLTDPSEAGASEPMSSEISGLDEKG